MSANTRDLDLNDAQIRLLWKSLWPDTHLIEHPSDEELAIYAEAVIENPQQMRSPECRRVAKHILQCDRCYQDALSLIEFLREPLNLAPDAHELDVSFLGQEAGFSGFLAQAWRQIDEAHYIFSEALPLLAWDKLSRLAEALSRQVLAPDRARTPSDRDERQHIERRKIELMFPEETGLELQMVYFTNPEGRLCMELSLILLQSGESAWGTRVALYREDGLIISNQYINNENPKIVFAVPSPAQYKLRIERTSRYDIPLDLSPKI